MTILLFMKKSVKINRKLDLPVSCQVANFFRHQIADGALQPGQKLPTTQEIAKFAGVGSHTVRAAMEILQKENLIESSPRRGTFVKDNTLKNPENTLIQVEENKNSSFRKIALMSAFGPGPDDELYRPETIAGVLKEAQRLDVVTQIFPGSLRTVDKEVVLKEILSAGVDGVVWPTPTHSEWMTIDYLNTSGVPVSTSRRSRCDDGRACVESDYDRAGFEAGKYLLERGCEKVLIFTFYDSHENAYVDGNGVYPLGIRHGVARAFEYEHKAFSNVVDLKKFLNYDRETVRAMLEAILEAGPETGIIFTNGYQFYEILKNYGEQARAVLADSRFIILSNNTLSAKLAPMMGDLNPMVLVDPFEEVGKCAVQKVMGMINGFMSGVTSLVKINMVEFAKLEQSHQASLDNSTIRRAFHE